MKVRVSCTSQCRRIIGFAYLNFLLSLLEKREEWNILRYNIKRFASVLCKCVRSSIIS